MNHKTTKMAELYDTYRLDGHQFSYVRSTHNGHHRSPSSPVRIALVQRSTTELQMM